MLAGGLAREAGVDEARADDFNVCVAEEFEAFVGLRSVVVIVVVGGGGVRDAAGMLKGCGFEDVFDWWEGWKCVGVRVGVGIVTASVVPLEVWYSCNRLLIVYWHVHALLALDIPLWLLSLTRSVSLFLFCLFRLSTLRFSFFAPFFPQPPPSLRIIVVV